MKPILYAESETTFTSNGLGQLNNAVSCYVEEERNGSYELNMVYPVDGAHFDEIAISCCIKAKPSDGKDPQPFRIYYISEPINGKVTVRAEHISYQASHIPVSPILTPATTPTHAFEAISNNVAESCPFTFWTDKTTIANFTTNEPASVRSLLGGTKGSILDVYGGELEWDKYVIKLHNHRGADNGVVLRYGKNITDIRQEINISNTITGVYPFWRSQDGAYVELPEKVMHHQNASNFPYQRTVKLDCSAEFEEAPTVTQLRNYANSYISESGIGVPKISITVSFLPLWQSEEYKNIANLERVNLCDTVTVEFEKLGISATAKVIRTKYDVLKERYEEVELGDAKKKSFSEHLKDDFSSTLQSIESIKSEMPTKTWLEQTIDEQTQLITGGLGGYVVFNLNSDGQPQEILIMDTDDIQTAVNVIRINKNGIGFSTSGYEGPFENAWTIAGVLSASFIKTGYLSANRIQGGTLTLGGANNTNGLLLLLDVYGNEIARLDVSGFLLSGSWEIKGREFESSTHYYAHLRYTDVDVTSTGDFYDVYDYIHPTGRAGYSTSRGLKAYGNSTWKILELFTDTNGVKNRGLQLISYENGGCVLQYSHGGGNNQDLWTSPTKISVHDNYNESIRTALIETMKDQRINWTLYSNNTKIGKIEFGEYYRDHTGDPVFYLQLGPNNEIDILITEDSIIYNGNTIHSASTSARKYKHYIEYELTGDRDPHGLLKLNPAQFIFNDDAPLQYKDMKGRTIPGLIAEDVAEIYPSAAITDAKTGEIISWDERRIIPGMLALIQEQDKKIKDLEARLKALEEKLCGL